MVWVSLELVLGAACAWVVGGSGRGVLPLLAGGLGCAGGRLVVGWLAVLVAPVVSGVGVFPSAVFGSVVVGVVNPHKVTWKILGGFLPSLITSYCILFELLLLPALNEPMHVAHLA